MHTYMIIHICGGLWCRFGVFLSCFTSYLLRQSSQWTRSSLMGQTTPGILFYLLLHTGIPCLAFPWVPGNPNSIPQTCRASTIPNEQPSQSLANWQGTVTGQSSREVSLGSTEGRNNENSKEMRQPVILSICVAFTSKSPWPGFVSCSAHSIFTNLTFYYSSVLQCPPHKPHSLFLFSAPVSSQTSLIISPQFSSPPYKPHLLLSSSYLMNFRDFRPAFTASNLNPHIPMSPPTVWS